MEQGIPDYRWTSRAPTFLGLHWSIMPFIPGFFVVAFISNWLPKGLHLMLWEFCATVLYLLFLGVCRYLKFGPGETVEYLWMRFVWRAIWGVRQ